eukprot:COSAG01_NODE_8505_length_2760_cov_45.512965_2_plen_153_part_00
MVDTGAGKSLGPLSDNRLLSNKSKSNIRLKVAVGDNPIPGDSRGLLDMYVLVLERTKLCWPSGYVLRSFSIWDCGMTPGGGAPGIGFCPQLIAQILACDRSFPVFLPYETGFTKHGSGYLPGGSLCGGGAAAVWLLADIQEKKYKGSAASWL